MDECENACSNTRMNQVLPISTGVPAGKRAAARSAGRRLPPLVALRAFEVVARRLSLAKAAEELCVTPAAVSHQIRTLEAHLGQPLFHRSARGLSLTDAGQACLPGIRDGFELLSHAISQIDSLGETGVLTVSVAPSFAVKWLVPRLDRFQALFPAIDVRVAASNQLANFANDGVDLAIRYGGGRYPELTVERLLPEAIFPVASPNLLARTTIARPADLANVTLLHDDSPASRRSTGTAARASPCRAWCSRRRCTARAWRSPRARWPRPT
jgi:LysR family glycine cleavage system transcriptional activator